LCFYNVLIPKSMDKIKIQMFGQTERRASSRHTSWSDVPQFKHKSFLIKLEMFAPCAQCQLEAWRSILKNISVHLLNS
jgi:hypothetical protein